MHPQEPARIAARRAGLAPEAGRVRDVRERQVVAGEDLMPVQIRERHLGRRHQEEVVGVRPVGVVLELGDVPGPHHRFP